ncbi:uncharacterized protein LOC133194291 [Saccostrea echinata]|uniref:uncharacterized protein LOC133194291 n=1 Tax=Saccostrea echinata TaxID=191078 RepID=UPI002A82E4AA|nr:uncharacterized protein LOC133194291 [Saccostrea echinata]
MEDIKNLEKEAQCALFRNDNKCALAKYNECLLLCEQHNLREDFKRIFGFKVILATLVQQQEEALYDSIKYVMLENHTEEGFWCASNAMKKLEKFDKALEYLIQGYLGAVEPCLFLIKIVHILVAHRSPKEKQFLSDTLKQYTHLTAGSVELQTAVVQKLAEENCWEGVSLLVTGIHDGPVSSLDKSASNCSAQKVPVGKLLGDVSTESLKHYGIELAKVLLENGASVQGIEKYLKIPIVHVGVKIALETENIMLLQWCFENYLKTERQRNETEKDGNSVLHIVAKATIGNEKQGIDILKILLEKGCSPNLLDADGKQPIEYITTEDFRYPLLNRVTNIDDMSFSSSPMSPDETEKESPVEDFDEGKHAVEKDFDFFLQKANESFQQGMLKQAVGDYVKALEALKSADDKTKLVNVHCSITECYLGLGNFTTAFEHAASNLPGDSLSSKP